MKHTLTILSSGVFLLMSTTAHAQFGLGGAQTVIDVNAVKQWPIQLEHMLNQLITLQKQLDDMQTQAGLGGAIWNEETDGFLKNQARPPDFGAVTYGEGSEDDWYAAMNGPEPIQDGSWLEASKDRGARVERTQHHILRLLHD